MRTFQQFLEATAEQMAIQKQRQAARVAKGGKGAEGSSGTHFHQKRSTDAVKGASSLQKKVEPQPMNKRNPQKAGQQRRGGIAQDPKKAEVDRAGRARSSFQTRTKPNYDNDPLAKASRGGALATTPKPKSRALATTPKPKSSALTTTPKPKGGALAKTGEVTPASGQRKKRETVSNYVPRSQTPAKKPEKTKNYTGYMSGVKKGLGGDLLRNDEVGSEARKKKGQQTANFVKSVPGKAGKYASNLAKSTRGKVGDSKAGQVQGSSEIIRGSRS